MRQPDWPQMTPVRFGLALRKSVTFFKALPGLGVLQINATPRPKLRSTRSWGAELRNAFTYLAGISRATKRYQPPA